MNSTAPVQIRVVLAEYEGSKKKITRREMFLAKMEQVAPWSQLMEVIELNCSKSGKRGRPPISWSACCACTYVEHSFHVVKNTFKYKKARYKGLAKNDA